MNADIRHVLFLCTGNVYRSRFAETLFRHVSWNRRLGWAAMSRGLSREFRVLRPDGPMSPHAVDGLRRRGIAVPEPLRPPRKAHRHDLQSARHVVAVCEREHRPLIEAAFPGYADRVEYWDIDDLDVCPPDVALAKLSDHVVELVDRLEHLDAMSGRAAGARAAVA